MSLIDQVMTANGDANYAYGKQGRHVIRIVRITLREPGGQILKPGFSVDGELLWSDRSDFAPGVEGGNKRGSVIRFNDPFRFPEQTLARARRTIHKAKMAKEGREIAEATLGLEKVDGEDDKAFAARVSAEVKRLLGPDQPLVGALLTVTAVERKNKQTGATYTLFEPMTPTEEDLRNAGLLK